MAERELLVVLENQGFDVASLWKARIDIVHEMEIALVKHGRPTSDPCRGVANLTEELGEVAKEAVNATRPNSPIDPISLRLMYTELAQLAGYAMLLMMSMRELYKKVENERK